VCASYKYEYANRKYKRNPHGNRTIYFNMRRDTYQKVGQFGYCPKHIRPLFPSFLFRSKCTLRIFFLSFTSSRAPNGKYNGRKIVLYILYMIYRLSISIITYYILYTNIILLYFAATMIQNDLHRYINIRFSRRSSFLSRTSLLQTERVEYNINAILLFLSYWTRPLQEQYVFYYRFQTVVVDAALQKIT